MKNRLIDYSKLKFEVHKQMRYDDVGDYIGNTIIAYDMGDEIVNNAIMLHEFIEYTLIKSAGIPVSMIDDFDTKYGSEDEHPEEYKLYRKFHRLANAVERRFIENLGLNWQEHEKTIDTAQVEIAMRSLENELHKEHPSEEKIEKSKEVVEETFEPIIKDD
jgi:hypothetical protein